MTETETFLFSLSTIEIYGGIFADSQFKKTNKQTNKGTYSYSLAFFFFKLKGSLGIVVEILHI